MSLTEDEGWFDPDLGIVFFRDQGGNWTDRRVRERNPYAPLFYSDTPPVGVLGFQDGSMLMAISREMVHEATGLLPLLGDPNPDMVRAFRDNMGWEIRGQDRPVVSVWTEFSVRERFSEFRYAVGGVMMMKVHTPGGEDGPQHLGLGVWLGPVVVERLR